MKAAAIALAVLSIFSAGSASAEPFTILIYEPDAETALRSDATDKGQAYWAGYGLFAKEAQAAGVLRGGSALHTDGKTKALAGGQTSDGPFAQSTLKLSGYFQIDLKTMDEALAWAAKVPAANAGALEVRQGYPAPGM